MRIKSNWAKTDKEKTPQEIGGALAFVLWKIGDHELQATRKAGFEIEIGPQYFAFLSEFLIFLVMVADRVVYLNAAPDTRIAITSYLANRLGEHLSENKSRLLGDDFSDYEPNLAAIAAYKQRFLDQLNLRAGEYAEFHYDQHGPDFAFTRYLGFCLRPVMQGRDIEWVVQQMMDITAPDAIKMVDKTAKDLLGLGTARPRRARRSVEPV